MKYKLFKRISLFVLVLLVTFLFGCTNNTEQQPENKQIKLSIVSINDFHGQLEEVDGASGAARIAKFVNEVKEDNPEGTILLAAGDMFQGTAISNIGYGLDVVNFMNMLDFDAMTIGNHEFDWSLDKVLEYRDGNLENGEAEFPFLSSNIYQYSKEGLPDYIDEYTILEKSGLKVAVIGYIGFDQTNDIATSMIADYTFLEPLEIVKENIKKARTVDNADVVIVCCHDDNTAINNLLAQGTGEYEVDAIINAHTHDLENRRIFRSEEKRHVPVVQSSSSGEYVGQTTLIYDTETSDVVESAVINVRMTSGRAKDAEIEAYVNSIEEKYAPVFGRGLCIAGTYISRTGGTSWAVKALFNYSNRNLGSFDVAFINSGGIRASAFPIEKDTLVTVSRVYQIMPFDNTVKTVDLTGKLLKQAFNISDVVAFGNFTYIDGNYYVDEELILDDNIYSVVAIDYIFDKTTNPFLKGENIVSTGILFRDVLINELELIGQNNELWLG